MNDLKPSDPPPETLPPKGAKLARVSRILGWFGLVIAANPPSHSLAWASYICGLSGAATI
jgi:hypothetical protein